MPRSMSSRSTDTFGRGLGMSSREGPGRGSGGSRSIPGIASVRARTRAMLVRTRRCMHMSEVASAFARWKRGFAPGVPCGGRIVACQSIVHALTCVLAERALDKGAAALKASIARDKAGWLQE
eukprot:11865901-Alexandrium_andersonii.AAC.1